VLLLNSGQRLRFSEITAELDPKNGVEKPLRLIKKWPDVDYFEDYP
jgi:hypothetical protein